MSAQQREPIAIIGSACRFPGGCNTPSSLWELLREPRDILQKVPEERFNIDAFYHPDPSHHGTTNVQESYFLDENVGHFDANFFNISANEAEIMDPQQRLLMETVYDSLTAAGIPMEKLRGSDTAVYAGQMCDDWSTMVQKDPDVIPTHTGTGVARSILSNRISYFFDWHGPSMTIDTACSSSLVAVHEAVQVLRSGDSTVAIAAGSNLILSPVQYVAESKLRMLSPTGRCRMWDESADGYARGEGVAAVVLKTLSQAIADGDTIDCIIRETGVNQDGHSAGLTVPSNTAQTSLIRSTYAKAGLDVENALDRPAFYHAHGTGTKAGDPQEAQAIHNAFFSAGNSGGQKMYVGSIKTVIGHTEGTAGLASLMGASLAIQNKVIPPNLHFNKLNPDIIPFYSNFEVPTSATSWPELAPGGVRRASVGGYGFGGCNCHVILEEYVPSGEIWSARLPDPDLDQHLYTPLVFSASSPLSLKTTIQEHLGFLRSHPEASLGDVAYTLQHHRSTLGYRKAIVAEDYADALSRLKDALGHPLDTRSPPVRTPTVLGVFTGQGAQWAQMGARLLDFPFVQKRIAALEESLASLPENERPSWSLKEQLLAPTASSRIAEAALSQPLCTAVQVVLVDLLRAAGVKLDVVVGHSSGEIGAAYAAGLINSHDAIRIAYYRGFHAKLARAASGAKGAMAAIGTSFDHAIEFCDESAMNGRISVAAHNSPTSVTLSGDEDAIEEAIATFQEEQIFARRLKVDTAYHSAHMAVCADAYLQSLDSCGITVQQPPARAPVWVSSVLEATPMEGGSLNNHYWVENMVKPVLFAPAIVASVDFAEHFDLAIEFGPHPALKGPATDSLAEESIKLPYTGLLSRGKDDINQLSAALGVIWTTLGSGSVDFNNFDSAIRDGGESSRMVSGLPNYPFSHQRTYWSEPRASSAYHQNKAPPHPLLGMPCVATTTSTEAQWKNMLHPGEIPWLQGHKLQGQIVFPATAYLAMAIEALKSLAVPATVFQYVLEDIVLERAITFNDDNSGVETLFSVKMHERDDKHISAAFSCYSCRGGESTLLSNARGHITVEIGNPLPDTLIAPQSDNHFNMVDVDIGRFYSELTRIGYEYSEPFHGMDTIQRKLGLACGTLLDQSGSAWEDNLVIHPGMLDTALQTLFAAFCYPGDERLRSLHVPVNIASLKINPYFSFSEGRKQRSIPFETVHRDEVKSHILADVQLLSEDGQHAFLQIEGASIKPFTPPRPEDDATLFSSSEYRKALPDGEAASAGLHLSDQELKVVRDLERISFYYVRNVANMSAEDRDNALPHHKHMMTWADYVVNECRNGTHMGVDPSCMNDTEEDILALTDKYRHTADALLIESTGRNLPDTIRNHASILEHMKVDNLLDRFYEEGVGLSIVNWWAANMAKQISHRYPHMDIIEVGAGTGGSTQAILPTLGTAFNSYTYTDVSSGFFEQAEDKFSDFAGRMKFKVFDMIKTPAEQGFQENSYDMVLAANVLHVSKDLDQMMANVRRLLKPGGYLVNLEIVTNLPLRNGIIMGGLPGWWVGAENGRPHGPCQDIPSWDALYRRNGFSGIDSRTPIVNDIHAVTVMATQAIDDRVSILRSPSTLPESFASTAPPLIVVGGKSLATFQLTKRATSIVKSRFSSFTHFPGVDALNSNTIPENATVLSLTDLDEPFMKSFTPAKLEGLQALWTYAHNILWVTKDARYEPYSNMIYGIGRVIRPEHSNVNLQLLDVDSTDDASGQYIGEALLRHQVLDTWAQDPDSSALLCSSEPELYLEKGETYIPRLYLNKAQNDRLNSRTRPITRDVDPASTTLQLAPSNKSIELHEVTELERVSMRADGSEKIRVQHSLLQFVKAGSVGNLMLCVGAKEEDPSSTVLALVRTPSSPASIDPECSIEIPEGPEFAQMALLTTGAYLVAKQIASLVPHGGIVLVHECDKLLKDALSHESAAAGIKTTFTTSQPGKHSSDWKFLHPALPVRILQQNIPSDVAVFVDFSTGSAVTQAVTKMLPSYCTVVNGAKFIGNETVIRTGASFGDAALLLEQAWKSATSSRISLGSPESVSLADISKHIPTEEPFTVVDWTVPTVPVRVRPVDENSIFASDKTYLLVGLSGEVGQSLAAWMVKHGARYVVLSSRKPVVDPDFIDSLEKKGANIRAMSLDITSRDSLNKCLKEISRSMPAVAGIANGALTVADMRFDQMQLDDMNKVLAARVHGSTLLDDVFHDTPLDFFIMFSSLTTYLGNMGQSNYAASNMYMSALAQQRRRRGFAASVIELSSLMGIGHVRRNDALDAAYFRGLGATNVSETDLHTMFAEAISVGKPGSSENLEIITGMSPLYHDELDNLKADYRRDLKLSQIVLARPGGQVSEDSSATVSVKVQLKAAKSVAQVARLLLDSFTKRVKKVLQIPSDQVVHENETLVERGVDSLVALEIRSWFVRELDVDMPVLMILGGNSIGDLIKECMKKIKVALVDISTLPATSDDDDDDVIGNIPSVPIITEPTIEEVPIDAVPTTLAEDISRNHLTSRGLNILPSTTPSTIGTSTPAVSESDQEYDRPSTPYSQSSNEGKTWRDDVLDSSKEIRAHMSCGQTRFWYLHQALKDKTTFNVAISISLSGRVKADLLDKALQAVAQKHEAMRTYYQWSGENMDTPTQVILSQSLIRLEQRKISSKAEADKTLDQMRDHQWNLNDPEAMKFVLLSLSKTQHWLVFGCHHITLDGVGINIIFADLEKSYQGQRLALLPEKSQYRTYSALQHKAHTEGEFHDAIEFYRKMIPADVEPIQLLPFSKSGIRAPQESYRVHRADVRLDAAATMKIKQVARQNQSSNFHLYTAVLQALLFRMLPDTPELFIGIADANRTNDDFKGTLGFFLNLLPLRFDRHTKRTRFGAAVKAARNKSYAALSHSNLPFDVLLNELGITRSANAPPIFQVFVDYRQGTQERAAFADLHAAGEQWYHPRTGYDISLDVLENASGDTLVTIQLQQSLYSQEHTELFLNAYVELLKAYTQEPERDIAIEKPCLWPAADVSEALEVGTGPANPLQWPQTVSHRIEQMIAEHGSEPALKDGSGTTLTYTEMDRRVIAIAEALNSRNLAGQTVGVCQEPSAEWQCSMLAIWRIGGTYLPLDLRNSVHRLSAAVETAKPAAVLADSAAASIVASVAPDVPIIDVSEIATGDAEKSVPNLAKPSSPAVILFTSGSTAEPKGILIKHSNLVAQNEGFSLQCHVDEGGLANVLQQSPLSFDFSLEQSLLALCNGGCLHIVPKEKRGDPSEVTKLMVDEHVTYTAGTPSEFRMWFEYGRENLTKCSRWKIANIGGEPFADDFVREFRKLALPSLHLFNNYGPGETTIAATYEGEVMYNDRALQYPLPAGRPAPNYAIYIVDDQLNMLPIGVPGEIVIGGAGVSAGYLGLDEATRAKFLPNAFCKTNLNFATNGWDKMYRTGDRGRLHPNGTIQVEGRVDNDTQVKLRGFRIELGEIEHAIVATSGSALTHAVVTVRQDVEKFLAAHVVFSQQHPEEGRAEFLDSLLAKLPVPEYMRPAVIVPLGELPLTAHNKIDRKHIQSLPLDFTGSVKRLVADGPLSVTEERLLELWRELLPAGSSRKIGSSTDFFHVGGSSLLLVQLQRAIKTEFSAAPQLNGLMNASRLGEMAAVITATLSASIDWEAETAIPESWDAEFSSTTANMPAKGSNLNILVTGPTGYIGRYLLPELVKSDRVSKLYCLVRPETDTTTLEQTSDKIQIFTGELGLSNLGLGAEDLDFLTNNSDMILHAGALRAFWDDYEALRPVNLNAVKELAHLALGRRIPLHFLTSGAVRIYGNKRGAQIYNIDPSPVDDTPPKDGTDGYVACKWAAERFLTKVATQFDLPVVLHTPMPTPGAGPDDKHVRPEPDRAFHELVSVTKTLGIRPAMDELQGWADILPVENVVSDMMTALFTSADEPTEEVRRVLYTGVQRINWQRFITELQSNPELSALPSEPTLIWIGRAKRGGYSYFMPAHRIALMMEGVNMVSRR
ncbi:equisetin synthetase [Massarina eburnea CBS 473.64]|uniref:Equisetin synthetase n=1 Tax=Massarina eburnea CBS 473.64 TaxID=1395130 RepID=A0A6A6SGE9_9PLEO|nr:equisetin synthetase [Massarina eburnea CBS 473.64]